MYTFIISTDDRRVGLCIFRVSGLEAATGLLPDIHVFIYTLWLDDLMESCFWFLAFRFSHFKTDTQKEYVYVCRFMI